MSPSLGHILTKDRIILVLILLLAFGVFFINVLLLPGVILPGPPYFVAILLAAYYLSPREAVAITLVALTLKLLADFTEQAPVWQLALYAVAILMVGYLSVQLSVRRRSETLLADERARLAEIAQRRVAELQGVIDNIVDAVFVCNAEGRITLANEAGRRLFRLMGIEEADPVLTGLPARLRMRHLDGRPVADKELSLALALAGEIVLLKDEVVHNPETQRDMCLRTSGAPIKDDKGKTAGAVVVVRDVTELLELDRLKDQFVEVAAHELKTPVTGIRGYAQHLIQREHEGVSPQGLKALQAINRQTERINEIINDLLDISRLRLGRLELSLGRLDLPQFVEEVVDHTTLTTAKHRIRVLKADPVAVRGDRSRLEQVLVNLLDNAIRYSPDGGDIDVAVARTDHEAVVSVRDYGIGIPKEKQARIFQRFYRAHTGTPFDYGGMGVGLYISNEIIARHGGRMWFESEEGKGSAFYFTLPLA